MAITAVFFDFIGTTVIEKNNDVVLTCFQNAFADAGIPIDKAALQQHRGKDKDEMIAEILKASGKGLREKSTILNSFKKHFTDSLDQFSENDDELEE